jgi:hypothetical protein
MYNCVVLTRALQSTEQDGRMLACTTFLEVHFYLKTSGAVKESEDYGKTM